MSKTIRNLLYEIALNVFSFRTSLHSPASWLDSDLNCITLLL